MGWPQVQVVRGTLLVTLTIGWPQVRSDNCIVPVVLTMDVACYRHSGISQWCVHDNGILYPYWDWGGHGCRPCITSAIPAMDTIHVALLKAR